MKEIPLTKGYVALIDDEDYERVAQFKWHVQIGRRTAYGVRTIPVSLRASEGRCSEMLHRFLLNAPDGIEVDHVDHDGLNNTQANLRLALHAQNSQNTHVTKQNSSGFRGVSYCKAHRRWVARIRAFGRDYHVGEFRNLHDAARAYNAKAKELHGEFAWLNPVPEAV